MDGILVIKKEKGLTSRDVVNQLSKKFNIKKMGHTGTLDPLATGVLVVAINEGCKIIELLTSTYKEYIATVLIGNMSDTLDTTGKITEEKKVDHVSVKKLKEVISSFNKTYIQEVPKYSAVKVNGKRLYQYARENIDVSLPKREVTVSNMNLVKEPYQIDGRWYFSFSCRVSKGTYIRSLIKDLGESYGLPFIMHELKRVKQGKFLIENAKTIKDVTLLDVINIYDVLSDEMEILKVNNQDALHISNGMIMDKKFKSNMALLVMNDNTPLAIYKEDLKDKKKMRPYKIFNISKEK